MFTKSSLIKRIPLYTKELRLFTIDRGWETKVQWCTLHTKDLIAVTFCCIQPQTILTNSNMLTYIHLSKTLMLIFPSWTCNSIHIFPHDFGIQLPIVLLHPSSTPWFIISQLITDFTTFHMDFNISAKKSYWIILSSIIPCFGYPRYYFIFSDMKFLNLINDFHLSLSILSFFIKDLDWKALCSCSNHSPLTWSYHVYIQKRKEKGFKHWKKYSNILFT